MTDVRNLFTLGIELEFALQGDEDIYEEIVAWLKSRDILVTAILEQETQLHDKWIVKKDESIGAEEDNRIPQPRIGVELVSPILVDIAGDPVSRQKWKGAASKVLTTLMERYTLFVNKSTGFHVHIGVGAKVLGLPGTLTLVDLKKIATGAYLFEEIIDTLHAQHRLGQNTTTTDFVRSIRQNGKFGTLTAVEAINTIWSKGKLDDFMTLMNPPHTGTPDGEHRRRYYKVNFLSYFDKGTVEFRQHEGTVDQGIIFAWVQFVLTFVRNIVNLSDTKVKKLQPTAEDLLSLVGKTTFEAMQR
ncbi:hypothetical protein OBBRIDRAFT_885989 [Obba rivulosa]|uniref:Amidoligase enzyme n=1 Tax=Obba rivulosa TaxID=1052685 RepID=A0A8E2B588_9APHY|nr:hypothetical protein OBBRIDRAFT_885989 [Obba rivulosa]